MSARPAAGPGPAAPGAAGEAGGGAPALWPHQRDAAEAVASYLACGGRCQVVMACGTGKTRVGAEASRRLAPGGKVLVVVPTQELLAQTAAVYAGWPGAADGAIAAVCSDGAATAAAGEVRGEMARLRAPVSTDPAEVAAWLRAPGRATVLTTYASLAAVRAAHQLPGVPGWDLVVVDEAHRAAGRAGRAWSAVNDDAAIPAARRLYMTATPRVLPGGDDIASMDDEKTFGPEVFRVSFAQAISQGLLADYRVMVTVVTGAEVAALAAGKQIVSARGPAVPARMLAAQVALLKAAARHGLRRVITYHHRVAGAHRFAATLLNAADLLPDGERPRLVRAMAVDGSMPLAGRREALRHLAAPGDRTVVVSNSRVLSEGVDVPDLDAVMFVDPRDSGTDVVQAVGRALRRGTGEPKVATIIIPVVLDAAEAAEAALSGSEFDTVWRVVRALRAHDERMAGWLDQARLNQPGLGPPGAPDPPAWLTLAGTPVSAAFAAALHVRVVRAGTSPWLEGYRHARAYHQLHGSLDIPESHLTESGFWLGSWLATQRTHRNQGRLDAGRARLLEALGITWDPLEAAWMSSYRELAAYARQQGHCKVPAGHKTPAGTDLAGWAKAQRAAARNGALPARRARLLDQIGFPWQPRQASWTRSLRELTAAIERHGGAHNLPPKSPAGAWLQEQHNAFRDGRLPAGRLALLRQAGIEIPRPDPWTAHYQALARYKDEHGHLRVPDGYKAPGAPDLRSWLDRQRARRKAGQLPAGQADLLDKLGIAWDPREDAWQARYHELRAFRQAPGHLRPPDGTPLGKWLRQQRKSHRLGKLPASHATLLRELGALDQPPGDPPPSPGRP